LEPANIKLKKGKIGSWPGNKGKRIERERERERSL
jgi:hypothetical protein